MIPKTYKWVWFLSELQDEKYSWACYNQSNDKMEYYLNRIELPKKDKGEITGIIFWVNEIGEIESVFLSESLRPWALNSIYRPLSFYRRRSWKKSELPEYWKEENPDYQERWNYDK